MGSRTLACAVSFAVLSSAPARADVTLTLEERDLDGESPATSSATMHLSSEHLAYRENGGDNAHLIFRGDKDVLWMLDDEKREYSTIDAQSMAEVGEQLGAAMKQMEAELANLPPEQRKLIEEAMKPGGAGAQVAAPSFETRKTSETKTVAGHTCTRHDVFLDDEKTAEVWVASFSDVGLSEADIAPMKDMVQIFQEMAQSMERALGGAAGGRPGGAFGGGWDQLDQLDGMPMLSRTFSDGQADTEWRVTSIDKGRVDGKVFELPVDYTPDSLQDSE